MYGLDYVEVLFILYPFYCFNCKWVLYLVKCFSAFVDTIL